MNDCVSPSRLTESPKPSLWAGAHVTSPGLAGAHGALGEGQPAKGVVAGSKTGVDIP